MDDNMTLITKNMLLERVLEEKTRDITTMANLLKGLYHRLKDEVDNGDDELGALPMLEDAVEQIEPHVELVFRYANAYNIQTLEEAVAWCIERGVRVEFYRADEKEGYPASVQIFNIEYDRYDPETIGFGLTFLEAAQNARVYTPDE